MPKVLIIDDNEAVCTALQVLLDLHEIDSVFALSPEEGLALARRESFGVILQDMNFSNDSTSGEEGVNLFRDLRAIDPQAPILLMTAWTHLETAVKLVKEGANDYLGKPWDDEKLVAELKHLLAMRATSLGDGDADLPESGRLCGMVYADPATRRLVAMALQVAKSDVPVLITGPNGSGKEVLAQIIQENSPRRGKPFVKVNAGGLPSDLLESELFGVEPGAFTGAAKRRVGRFDEAHQGTLFLDEIGNLPLNGQIKLLRVLQTGEYSMLGSNRVRHADVRIISATNADLGQAIRDGSFREDLYFRLNVVELRLPALAERPGDILPLAHHFLKTLPGGADKRLGPDAEAALTAHAWPGNVRELRNLLQRALLISPNKLLTALDLGLDSGDSSRPISEERGENHPFEHERARVASALREANGNVSRAADLLGLSRQALYRRMAKHGIVWERRPKG